MAKKHYETLGVMIDFSRNGVMTLESLKNFLTVIRKMGYNTAEEFNQKLLESMSE